MNQESLNNSINSALEIDDYDDEENYIKTVEDDILDNKYSTS